MNLLTRRCLHATRLLYAADNSLLSSPVNRLIPWLSPTNTSTPNSLPISPHPPSTQTIPFAVKAVSDILTDPGVAPGEPLHSALERTGILPSDELLTAVFDRFVPCPKLLCGLFTLAEKNKEAMGGVVGDVVCEKVVNALGKAREFDLAWDVIRGRGELATANAFVILIRRYARAGLTENAIQTFEHAFSLDIVRAGDSETRMLEILLDSLCKEGHVDVASRYFSKWIMWPVPIYNPAWARWKNPIRRLILVIWAPKIVQRAYDGKSLARVSGTQLLLPFAR